MARRNDVEVNVGGNNKGAQAALDATTKGIKKFAGEAGKLVQGLGGQVFSLRGAIAGLVGAISAKKIVDATVEQERVVKQLETTLKSTKGAAGLTKDELLAMASSLQQVTRYGDETVISAENLLLTFTNIGRDVFPSALETVLDMATAMGTDLKGASIQLGKALNDPIKGVSALAEVGVNFTDKQKNVIKALVETGRVADAQRLILQELQTEFGGSARAAREGLGGALEGLKNSAGDLLEADGASLPGVTKAVEDLTKTLNDPQVRAGFQALTGAVLGSIRLLAEGVADAKKFIDERRISRVAGEIKSLNDEIDHLQEGGGLLRVFGRDVDAEIDAKRRRIAELRAQLNQFGQDAVRNAIGLPGPLSGPDVAIPFRLPGGSSAPSGPTPLTQKEKDAAAKALEARLKAIAAADAAVLQAELAKAEAELEDSFKRRLIDVEQYYQAKLDLTLAAIDAEIEALQKARERADAAERIQIDGQLEALRIKRVAAAQQLARDEVEAYKEERERALKEVQQDVADVLAAFDRAQTSATSGVQTGALSPDAAQSLVRDNASKALEALRLLRPQLQALAQQDVPGAAEAFDSLNVSIEGLVQKTQGPLATALQNLRLEWANVQQSFAGDTVDALKNSIAGFFTDLVNGAKSAGEAARDFALGFIRAMADVAARALATYATLQLVKAAGVTAGVAHSGGFAGETGKSRVIPGFAFAGAPRLHDGGVLGLRPGEVPAILERGEEVLAKNDPRNARNGGANGSGGTRIINVIDPNLVGDYLSSSSGERTILNVIQRNAGAIKQTLG